MSSVHYVIKASMTSGILAVAHMVCYFRSLRDQSGVMKAISKVEFLFPRFLEVFYHIKLMVYERKRKG